MSNKRKSGLAFQITAAKAQHHIRDLAQVTENIKFTLHAMERMDERGIDDVDVMRTLRAGFVDEPPQDLGNGEWQAKVTRAMKGGRSVGVVCISLRQRRLVIRTVEWEDLP